jgi:hypothetical protein
VTTAASGVTERPYLLGDRIVERGRIGQGNFEATWKVAEHVRPRRVVLQSESSPVQIIYSFNARGNVTEYTRELKYNVEDLTSISPDPNKVNRLMQLRQNATAREEKRGYRRTGEAYRYFAMAARSLQKRALIHFST